MLEWCGRVIPMLFALQILRLLLVQSLDGRQEGKLLCNGISGGALAETHLGVIAMHGTSSEGAYIRNGLSWT